MGSAQDAWWNAPIVMTLLKNLLIAGGFFAIIFFVIKPLMRMLPHRPPSFQPVQEDLEMIQLNEAHKQEMALQTLNQLELIEKVKQDPYQVAQILQNWLVHKEQ